MMGYEKALHYLRDYGYKAHITMTGERLDRFELVHPDKPGSITVRRDSAKRLIPLCHVTGSVDHFTAIMEYNAKEV